MEEKKFVKVIAAHQIDGTIRPLSIEYQDNRYDIDRITDVRAAASLKTGGQGTRYACQIAGKRLYLFCDDGRWFLEA